MRLFETLILLSFPLAGQTGIITTIAGTVRGYGGDGGPATAAQLTFANVENECDPARFEELNHISVDRAGNIYVADTNANRIRKIAPDGTITTIAGNGQRPPIDRNQCSPAGGAAETGDGGPATAAKLYGPSQALMLPNGLLLICDQKYNRIRQVTPSGTISTVVGNERHSFFVTGLPASQTWLDSPSSVAVDSEGRGYFAELHSNRIGRANSDGRVQVVAGTAVPGFGADGPDATKSAMRAPTHIVFDKDGNLLVAEQGNHRVRRIAPGGSITTIAGTGVPGFGGDGGPAREAMLNLPTAIASDAAGNVYIADMGNHRVRRIGPDGTIQTVAGNGEMGRGADGIRATESALHFPSSVSVDAAGDLLIADWQNYRIRKVTLQTRPAIFAGGIGNAASFAADSPSPGSLISIFGERLAEGLAQASTVPLPTELAGVSVSVNGTPIPLVFVSPGQINAQLPYDLPDGEAKVRVKTVAGESVESSIRVGGADPGIFVAAGSRRAIALNQDGRLNSVENPERPGAVITLFLTGLGRLDGVLTAGQAAPAEPLLRAAASSSATVGGREAQILFLGLTPGFVGLAQANVVIPGDVPAGPDVETVVRIGGRASRVAVVAVR